MAIPVITSSLSASANVGSPFSYTITASGSPNSLDATISPSGLPAGLEINNVTGLISGTPTIVSQWAIRLSAENGDGTGFAVLDFRTVPAGAPRITTDKIQTVTVGTPVNIAIATAGGTPTGFGGTFFVPGLTLNTSTGHITGTPTVAGTYGEGSITASNASGIDTKLFQFNVLNSSGGAPVVTSDLLVYIFSDDLSSYTITASASPTSFGATSLPLNLTINDITGEITGQWVDTPGRYVVPITVTNGAGTRTAFLVFQLISYLSSIPVLPEIEIQQGISDYWDSGQEISFDYPMEVYANLTSIGQDWNQVEKSEGLYDFSYFERNIKIAAAAEKKIILRIETSGGAVATGGTVPDYIYAAMGTIKGVLYQQPGLTYSFDTGDQVYNVPLPWNTVFHAHKRALYTAFGAWFTATQALTPEEKSWVMAVNVAYANTLDQGHYLPHGTAIVSEGGPEGFGYDLSEADRWTEDIINLGSAYTTQKMIDVAIKSDNTGLIDTVALAFPNQFVSIYIGYNGPDLDSPHDGHYLSATVAGLANSKYGNNVITESSAISTTTPFRDNSEGTTWDLYGDLSEIGYSISGKALASIWGDTFDTGGNGYRMNGGVATDPDGVIPPPLTAAEVYRKSAEKLATYAAFFYEVYHADILNNTAQTNDYVQQLFTGEFLLPHIPPVITSAKTFSLDVDEVAEYQITADYDPTSFKAVVIGHEEGLTAYVDEDGLVQLIGNTQGIYHLKITATNEFGATEQLVAVSVLLDGVAIVPLIGIGDVSRQAFPEVAPYGRADLSPSQDYVDRFGLPSPSSPINLMVTTPQQSNSGTATASWGTPRTT